jgi:hypothetical protein
MRAPELRLHELAASSNQKPLHNTETTTQSLLSIAGTLFF